MFALKSLKQQGDRTILLEALTPEMETAMGGLNMEVGKLPYRVGRQPRARHTRLGLLFMERHLRGGTNPNQLEICDEGPRLHISRRHFRIVADNGAYLLEDLGSACGTIVDSTRIGGHGRGGKAALRDGSVIILGTSVSPYMMRFRLQLHGKAELAMAQLTSLKDSGILSEDTFEAKARQVAVTVTS